MSKDHQLFSLEDLSRFAAGLFRNAGMEDNKAAVMAGVLLEADLLGHKTHGIALVDWYLSAIANGQMNTDGEPEVVSRKGNCLTWNGRRLPGTWLTSCAFDAALERARMDGIGIVSISNSHHIGALAAYLPKITEQGFIGIVTCSTASVAGVAPYGGTEKLFTPNPIAAGFPTDGDPILLDISASITTLSLAKELAAAGRKFEHPWILTAEGEPTNDPAAVMSEGGSLLPLGGIEYGHKGFAIALLIECLTQGLSGCSRADQPAGTCTSVFVQVIDPNAFAGRDAMLRQSTYLAEACRSNPPRPGVNAVRVPGDKAMQLRRQALKDGVPIAASTVVMLREQAVRSGLSMPMAQTATETA